jgi:glycosyltransferase involved in cell wall biosynthesis
MKACFIVGTLARGGAEKQLVFMLRALTNEGVRPHVLCLTQGEAFEKEIKNLGVEVEWVGSMQSRLVRLANIVRRIRKISPDVLQSSHFYTNIYTGAAGRILDIPSIGAIRNDLLSEVSSNGLFGRAQLTWPSHLIVNSKLAESRAIAARISPGSLTFIQNVVEPSAQHLGSSSRESVKILFVGRFVRQKRPDAFVDLAERLRTRANGVKLKFQMVGDGNLRPEIEKLARDKGFTETDFELSGERSEMYEVYKGADILVSTSEHEGTPNVVLEAMSCGLPVVATRVGGVPEVLSERCGSLVDPSDRDGMLDCVSRFVLNPQLRAETGIEGRKHVAANHSLKYLQQKLKVLYSKLIER